MKKYKLVTIKDNSMKREEFLLLDEQQWKLLNILKDKDYLNDSIQYCDTGFLDCHNENYYC
jgi:hypothetical protein